MVPRIKRVRHGIFLESELISVNPMLLAGEIIVALDDNSPTDVLGFKIGPGNWNSLPFSDDATYKSLLPITNPIGDLQSGAVITGDSITDIIEQMISPFVGAAISGASNDGAGVSATTALLEVGQSISGVVTVTFIITDPGGNLNSPTPIRVNTSGFFVEVNPYSNAPIGLVPTVTIAPTSPLNIDIDVFADHTQGFSGPSTTNIKFDPRIIWGASALTDLTSDTEVNQLLGGGSIVTSDFTRDYSIDQGGYSYILVPAMLSPGAPTFSNVTDPNAPASIQMVPLGTILHNNGVGTYNYEKFRSPFLNINPIILRVA